jgi:hypothetical protein
MSDRSAWSTRHRINEFGAVRGYSIGPNYSPWGQIKSTYTTVEAYNNGLTMPLLFWLGLSWAEKMTVTSFQHRTIDVRGGPDAREIVLMAIVAVAVLAVAPLSVWQWFNRL